MKERISAALAARHPTLKPYQINKSVSRYITVMLDAIAESIRKFGFNNDQISLSLDAIAQASGRISIKGKKFQTSVLLNSDPATSLVHVEFHGQVGQVARVSFNPVYQLDIECALMESRTPKSNLATGLVTSVDASTADADIVLAKLHTQKSSTASSGKAPNITTTVGNPGECQDSCRISPVLECVDSVLSSAGYAARRWSSLDGGLSQTSSATCHARGARFQRNGWRSRACA